MKNKIDLLKGNIQSSLLKLALPIMATSLIQMAYNMTDMVWIGRIGSGAVTAIGTAGMYLWISQGLVMMPKIGGQVKVAQAIGSNRLDFARKMANLTLQITVVMAVVYSVFLFSANEFLIAFFNLDSPVIIENAQNYLKIVSCGIIFTFFNAVMTGLLTATGDSSTPFKANTIGLVINIILDPILIFGMFFIPEFGVVGAAIATVIAQLCVSVYFLNIIIRDKYLFTKMNLFAKIESCEVQSIFRIGFPSGIQSMGHAFISMIISRFVVSFGDEAVAIQRVGSQIESISYMTADGLAVATNTFIAQNFGSGNLKRARRGYGVAFRLVSFWGIFTTLVLILGAGPIFGVFIHEPELMSMGIDYLRIIGVSQLFMCYEIVTSGAFAGFGKTSIPSTVILILNVARIPGAYLLTGILNSIDGIWWSVSLSSVFKGIILILLFLRLLKYMEKEQLNKSQNVYIED